MVANELVAETCTSPGEGDVGEPERDPAARAATAATPQACTSSDATAAAMSRRPGLARGAGSELRGALRPTVTHYAATAPLTHPRLCLDVAAVIDMTLV